MVNIKTISTLLVLGIVLGACQLNSEQDSAYPRWVGDIKEDSLVDGDYKTCNSDSRTEQYFHLDQRTIFEGAKKAIEEHFFTQYNSIDIDQSGLIRIRFVVNCKGESGRFRMMAMDSAYAEYKFDTRITDQLLTLTQSLKGWLQTEKNKPTDYYMYLIFKIEEGKLIEIMP
ncbi:MAG: hypothetical protein OCD76_20075 [Reichenbachiella sp.]